MTQAFTIDPGTHDSLLDSRIVFLGNTVASLFRTFSGGVSSSCCMRTMMFILVWESSGVYSTII